MCSSTPPPAIGLSPASSGLSLLLVPLLLRGSTVFLVILRQRVGTRQVFVAHDVLHTGYGLTPAWDLDTEIPTGGIPRRTHRATLAPLAHELLWEMIRFSTGQKWT